MNLQTHHMQLFNRQRFNGSNTTLGYNTQYGWGGGSAPQNMYFPNYNSGASEAAAVSSIARVSSFDMTSTQGSYMDNLIYNTMTRTIVFAFNQFHVVSSIGPLGSPYIGKDGGIYFANITDGYEQNLGNPFGSSGNTSYPFEVGPIGVGFSFEIGFPEWLAGSRVAFGYDVGLVADNTALGIGIFITKKKAIDNPLCFSIAPEYFYAHTKKGSQIKIKNLAGAGFEDMASAGPFGSTFGMDNQKTYNMYTLSGFSQYSGGIDIGYGKWETETSIYSLEDFINYLKRK